MMANDTLLAVEGLTLEVARTGMQIDHDFGVDEFVLKNAVWTILVRGYNQAVPLAFEKFPQAEFAGHAAEQDPWFKVNGLRRGKRLAARIAVKLR